MLTFDVGFPSLCCRYVLLLLVNKKSCFGLWQGRIVLGRKTNLNAGRKKAESERCHVTAEEEGCQNLTGKPQPYGDIQINKNGLI